MVERYSSIARLYIRETMALIAIALCMSVFYAAIVIAGCIWGGAI